MLMKITSTHYLMVTKVSILCHQIKITYRLPNFASVAHMKAQYGKMQID